MKLPVQFEKYSRYLPSRREVVCYLICGIGAACVNYGGFLFFSVLCGLHYLLSITIANLITWTYSFCVNKFFVFRAKTDRTLRESILFVLQQIVLFALSAIFMWIAIDLLKIPEWLAWFLASGGVLVLNFCGMKFLIWKKNG